MYVQSAPLTKEIVQSDGEGLWEGLASGRDPVQTLKAKDVLFCEGDPAGTVFEVVEGTICKYRLLIDGRRQVLGFAGPGDLIGLAQGDVHRFNCQAVTPARLRRIPKNGLLRTAAQRPEIGEKLLTFATTELAAMQDYCLLLSRKSAQERLVSFLLTLADQQSGGAAFDADGPVTVVLTMRRRDIADYLGLSVETVSRTLTALKNLGVIDVPHGSAVVIRDILELEELAEVEDDGF